MSSRNSDEIFLKIGILHLLSIENMEFYQQSTNVHTFQENVCEPDSCVSQLFSCLNQKWSEYLHYQPKSIQYFSVVYVINKRCLLLDTVSNSIQYSNEKAHFPQQTKKWVATRTIIPSPAVWKEVAPPLKGLSSWLHLFSEHRHCFSALPLEDLQLFSGSPDTFNMNSY